MKNQKTSEQEHDGWVHLRMGCADAEGVEVAIRDLVGHLRVIGNRAPECLERLHCQILRELRANPNASSRYRAADRDA